MYSLHISFFVASCTVGHACLVMNPSFRSNFPVFWESDTDNSYDEHNRYRPGQYFWERHQNNDANCSNSPKMRLRQRRRFWRPFSIRAIPLSYNQEPAVCQLHLPLLQHRQCPLMLKILARPVKIRQKRAEGMESGAKKRRSFLFNCGKINTLDLNRGMPGRCGKKSLKKFPKSGK